MKCPRCDSDIPEDMKFCGFCGVEVESGRKITLDAWNSYFNFILVDISELVSSKIRLMGLIGILTVSALPIWLMTLPFQTAQTLLSLIVPVLVLFFGLAFMFGLKDEIKAFGKTIVAFEDARLGILAGKLTTSKEIIAHLEDIFKQIKPSFKAVRDATRRVLDEHPQ